MPENEQTNQGHLLLPDCLLKKLLTYVVLGLLTMLLSISMCFLDNNPIYLAGAICGALLILAGIFIVLEFRRGRFIEKALLCLDVYKKGHSTVEAVFRDEHDPPDYFTFHFPKSKDSHLTQGAVYIIYFRSRNPNIPVAWTLI